ncbi:hypothetical protein HC752_14590 [Vibrio sp. S9_S30]|uniref:amidase n=1 Tax=Vibrio sp. S9_S30 TaxID=2720226 RepID=UPI0016818D24|nr:amidase family protein [Vibrio sp. S9_S30]MBD1558163.1 hypothetical protein [Vibrio sp. S9_S30]
MANNQMNISDLTNLTVDELMTGYRVGTIDPVEVMEVTMNQVNKVNGKINALYQVQTDAAMIQAQAAKERFRKGQATKRFEGVPVTIKDSVNAIGMTWNHGAKIHGQGYVAQSDSPPVEKLKQLGAIIVGKGTMPDFGLSGSGVSSLHGIVRNPWGLKWSPGGSSAGNGASMAAGIGMMSVGTDIAGSVRLPACHCGLSALKPTQGMISHLPASDVRSAGPIVRRAADLEPWLRGLGGVHRQDRLSVPVVEPSGGHDFSTAKIAVYRSFGFGPAVEADVLDILEKAEQAIKTISANVERGSLSYDFDAYLPIDDSFKWRGWREYSAKSEQDRSKTPPQMLEWFGEARDWSASRIADMEIGIAKGVEQTNALFDQADFILSPVMPIVSFPADSRGIDEKMPLRHCTFTAPFNQSGHPAVSMPAGTDRRGLPVGIQIAARRFDDIRLVRLAKALEKALWSEGPFDNRWPLEPNE